MKYRTIMKLTGCALRAFRRNDVRVRGMHDRCAKLAMNERHLADVLARLGLSEAAVRKAERKLSGGGS